MKKLQVPGPLNGPESLVSSCTSPTASSEQTLTSMDWGSNFNPTAQIATTGGIRHDLNLKKIADSPVLSTTLSTPVIAPAVGLADSLTPSFKSMPNFTSSSKQSSPPKTARPIQSQDGMNEPFFPFNSTETSAIHSNFTDNNTSTCQRRQKRLERNRESARLSRRRRKQYLEVLEERVTFLGEEMDKGRRKHVLIAMHTYQSMRRDVLNSITMALNSNAVADASYDHHSNTLRTSLSRTSSELLIAAAFMKQYLKSLTSSPATRFLLWLTLQNDVFFRGGRAASERLSAARIGERMLSCGNVSVPPSNGMWPLLCNEIGLSYDQEERVRTLQRQLIAVPESWLNRHTCSSSKHVIESVHKATMGASEAIRQRENRVMHVLTPLQRAKFFSWAASKDKNTISRLASSLKSKLKLQNIDAANLVDEKKVNLEPSPKLHEAANLYLINHKIQNAMKSFPETTPTISSQTLKRLSRRPSFESLAAVNEEEKSGPTKGKNISQSKSCGSLKRCSSEMSCDDIDTVNSGSSSSLTGIAVHGMSSLTPEAAQLTASHLVAKELGPVRSCMPTPLDSNRQQASVTPHSAARPKLAAGPALSRHLTRLPTIQQNQPSLYHHPTSVPIPQQASYQPTTMTAATMNSHNYNAESYQVQQPNYIPFSSAHTQQKDHGIYPLVPSYVPTTVSSMVSPTNLSHPGSKIITQQPQKSYPSISIGNNIVNRLPQTIPKLVPSSFEVAPTTIPSIYPPITNFTTTKPIPPPPTSFFPSPLAPAPVCTSFDSLKPIKPNSRPNQQIQSQTIQEKDHNINPSTKLSPQSKISSTEDGWSNVLTHVAEQSLLDFDQEDADWAIGEGFEMEL